MTMMMIIIIMIELCLDLKKNLRSWTSSAASLCLRDRVWSKPFLQCCLCLRLYRMRIIFNRNDSTQSVKHTVAHLLYIIYRIKRYCIIRAVRVYTMCLCDKKIYCEICKYSNRRRWCLGVLVSTRVNYNAAKKMCVWNIY